MVRVAILATIAVVYTLAGAESYAQTLNVIRAFSGPDGAFPYSGLTSDGRGNLYGTTSAGGNTGCSSNLGCGTVFKLSRSGAGWSFTTIYQFQGNADGWEPMARVVFGPDGDLYGTTPYGGNESKGTYGYGTVFKLTPPGFGDSSSEWTHSVLYRFGGGMDGATPGVGDLIFDAAGNIYGTTESGGLVGSSCVISGPRCGVVFELSPSSHGWTEHVIYSFTGGNDGDLPIGGVVFDPGGNLLGTASEGGAVGYGTVFELMPSGSGWEEKTLHSFTGNGDGGYPAASLSLDRNTRAFYGGTSFALPGGGTVFQLTKSAKGYTFQSDYLFPFPDDPSSVITESGSNLYGTTPDGGSGWGNVFEMIENSGVWEAKIVYNFTGQNDGNSPEGNILVDSNGNVYGTTTLSGEYSDGVIYEIMP
ncbi:MAG TPA: choice-of-anchor tandem repeat GloVer-containing protein [Candidatus Sulfotelmatobacter sp.]|nr:choice-of-anchor tandem repeat GloVer-containing protein [Candidatus Sulfotelmatobacter sp.]